VNAKGDCEQRKRALDIPVDPAAAQNQRHARADRRRDKHRIDDDCRHVTGS